MVAWLAERLEERKKRMYNQDAAMAKVVKK
jgi:hypothetical protein